MNCGYVILLLSRNRFVNHNGHRIVAGRHVLEGNAVLLKSLQNLAAKADLGIHHGLRDRNRAETLLTGYTRDRIIGLSGCALDDPGTFIFRTVCIFNVDRDALGANREIASSWGRRPWSSAREAHDR